MSNPSRATHLLILSAALLVLSCGHSDGQASEGMVDPRFAALEGERPTRALDPAYDDDPARVLHVEGTGWGAEAGVDSSAGVELSSDGLRAGTGAVTLDGATLGLRADRPWTLSLGLQVGGDPGSRPSSLVRCAGLFDLTVDKKGRVRVDVGPDGERKRGLQEAIELHAPQTLTVAWDPTVLEAMRVVVGSEVIAVRLDGLVLGEPPLRFELGAGLEDVTFAHATLLARAVSTEEVYRRTDQPLDPHDQRPPLEETVPVPVADLAGDVLLDWGVTGHLAFDDGRLVRAEGQWSWLDTDAGTGPIARTTHVLVDVGEGELLLFASEARDTHIFPMRNTNDAWLLDTAAGSWSPLEVDGPAPEPRCHQTAAYDPEERRLFYGGGFRNDVSPVELFADAWLLDLDERRWARIAGPEDGLEPYMDSIVFFRPEDGRFYVSSRGRLVSFGSERGDFRDHGRLRYEDADGQPLAGVGAVSSPTTIFDPERDRAIVFGGSSRNPDSVGPWEPGVDEAWSFTNRTWFLDAERATMRLARHPADGYAPRVRSAAGLDPRTGHVVAFGGVRDQYSERFGDLWRFDPETERWQELRQAGAPGRRGGFYGMPFDEATQRFVLTHGRSAVERFHDDTWLLDYAPDAVGTGRWLFDRAGFPELGRLTVAGRGSEGGDLRVEVLAGATPDTLVPVEPEAGVPASARYVEVRVTISGEGSLERIAFEDATGGDAAWHMRCAPLDAALRPHEPPR